MEKQDFDLKREFPQTCCGDPVSYCCTLPKMNEKGQIEDEQAIEVRMLKLRSSTLSSLTLFVN